MCGGGRGELSFPASGRAAEGAGMLADQPSLFDPSRVGPADLAAFWASMVAYLVFLLVGCVLRIGRGATSLGRTNGLHFRMTWLYLALVLPALYLSGKRLDLSWLTDIAIGAFFYFGLHYGIFANFFALAQASVSASIVSIIHAQGGAATRATITSLYRNGEGFESIKRHRIERLDTFLGWARREGDTYRLTPKGTWAVRATRFFLKVWGLGQLGQSRG